MATPSMPQCSPHPTKDSFVITDDDPSVCSENPDTMDAMRQRLDPDRGGINDDHDVILSYDNFQLSSADTTAYDDGDGGGDGTAVVNASTTSAASSSSSRHPLHLEQKLEHALSTIESLTAERDADRHIIESLTAELQQRLEREKREELQRRENPMPPLLVSMAAPPKKQQQQQRKNKGSADNDSSNTNEQDNEQSSLLAELQSSLHSQMSRRAEAEERVRQISYKLTSLEDKLDRLQTSNTNLLSIRSKLENEISKLRTKSDESERREAVLNNRLNDARKKEALKYSDAHRFELENVELKEQIGALTKTVDSVTNEMKSLVVSSDKLKLRCVERVKSAETALMEERKLNDERKQKMKLFVENKAEELKKAKHIVERVQKELDESRTSHRQTISKLDSVNAEWESLHVQNQQLQHDLNQLRHDIDTKGDKLQIELERTALNAQEQKSKRMSATHELMTLLRKVEAERTISSKLREGIRYRLTPKASGQLKLLNETLRDFENELQCLARRVGRPLPPPPTCSAGSWDHDDDNDKEAGIGEEKKPLYYGGFVGFGHNANAASAAAGDNNGSTNNNDHHGVLNFAAAAAAASGIEPLSTSSRRSSSMSNTPKSTSSSTHSTSSPSKSSGAAAAGATTPKGSTPDPSKDVLSTLESESENIGKGIESFLAGVERMHLLLVEGDGRTQQQQQGQQQQQERSCMSAFAELVLGGGSGVGGGAAGGAAGMPMTSLLLMAHGGGGGGGGNGNQRRRGSVMDDDEDDENDEMVAMVSNGDDNGGLSSSSLGGNGSGHHHYSPVSGRYYE